MRSDQVLFLLLGIVLGYVLGQFQNQVVAHRKEPKQMAKTTDVSKSWIAKVRAFPGVTASNVALFLILAFTVWAAITSQINSNAVANQTAVNERVTSCVVTYLDDTIDALNARTANGPAQTQATLDLQQAQEKFFSSINPTSPTLVQDYAIALQTYQKAYARYTQVVNSNRTVASMNDYPTPDELRTCIANNKER